MRAVRFHGKEDVRVDEIEEPVCGAGQVKVGDIQVQSPAGQRLNCSLVPDQACVCWNLWKWYVLCQSRAWMAVSLTNERIDLHEFLHGPRAVPTTPHKITGDKLPTTLGHEFSGTIEEVGEGVTGFKVGDKVAINPSLSDGSCGTCQMGRNNVCNNLGFIGYSSEFLFIGSVPNWTW